MAKRIGHEAVQPARSGWCMVSCMHASIASLDGDIERDTSQQFRE